MIALLDSLPLLRVDPAGVESLRYDWLCHCLRRAADRAGYLQWWLAEHVAQSALWYLAHDYPENVITREKLETLMRSVLQAIGYSEVALHYEFMPPPVQVSLSDLAGEAGPGYELAFFQLLKERIEPLIARRTPTLELHGLQNCVRHLHPTKTWNRNCNQLRNEIVAFIREHVEKKSGDSEVWLTIR